MSQDSFNEHLDGRGSAFLENVQRWRLTEAVRCPMSNTYRRREWSRFTGVACCGHEVSFFSSNLVDEICHPMKDDRPAEL